MIIDTDLIAERKAKLESDIQSLVDSFEEENNNIRIGRIVMTDILDIMSITGRKRVHIGIDLSL